MGTTSKRLEGLGAFLSSLFMPALCVHCGRDRWRGTPLCLRCLRKAEPIREPAGSARPLSAPAAAGRSPAGSEVDPEIDAGGSVADLRFLFRMGPQLSTLIHGFKYRHRPRHIRFLCAYLRYRPDLAEWARSYDVLVPVPIHAARLRERGYNQAARIAREAAEHLGLPVSADALIRVRATESQTKLNRLDRGSNLENAFACAPKAGRRGKRILLVDDVYTTGATVGRCADTLLAAGVSRVGVLALARVESGSGRDDFELEMEAVSSYAS